jgi:hypothetical protein
VEKGVHLGRKVGVDSLEVGGRLPTRERGVRPVAKERHFRLEIAMGTARNDPGLLTCIVFTVIFQNGMQNGVFRGRRDCLDVLGCHCED